MADIKEPMMNQKTNSAKTLIARNLFQRGIPFLVCGILLLIFFFSVTPSGDDIETRSLYQKGVSVFEWLQNRYANWSSRVIIDFVMFYMCGMPVVFWRIINTMIYVLLAIFTCKLFFSYQIRCYWLVCFLIIAFCSYDIYSAGYISTSINYAWVITAGLAAMLPIRKMLNQKPIRFYDYLYAIPALLFSANHEMSAIILFAICILFMVYFWSQERKLSLFLMISSGIIIAMLIFEITCPGNSVRAVSSAGYWFPGHERLSFIHKLEIGYSTTFSQFLKPNILFLTLFGTAAYLIWKKESDSFYRFIGIFPFAISLIFGFLAPAFSETFPILGRKGMAFAASKYGLLSVDNAYSVIGFFTFMLITTVLISSILDIYLIYGWTTQFGFLITLFLVCALTRIMIGFSPSVSEGLERVSSFFFYGAIIPGVSNFQQIEKEYGIKKTAPFLYGTGFLSMTAYFSLFVN